MAEKRFQEGEVTRKVYSKDFIKILFRQNDKKFENKYLKIERNWKRWKRKDKTI